MVTLETGCSTQSHPTVFTVVPCFMTLTLFIVNSIKKFEQKVKLPLTEHFKNVGVSRIFFWEK
jgi:hypothetical protein